MIADVVIQLNSNLCLDDLIDRSTNPTLPEYQSPIKSRESKQILLIAPLGLDFLTRSQPVLYAIWHTSAASCQSNDHGE